jgi:hypothetical protein
MAMIGLAASIVLKPVHVAVDSIGVGDDFNKGVLELTTSFVYKLGFRPKTD